jgi:hypothetical protein
MTKITLWSMRITDIYHYYPIIAVYVQLVFPRVCKFQRI